MWCGDTTLCVSLANFLCANRKNTSSLRARHFVVWQKSKPGLTELTKCGQACKEVSRSRRKCALTLLGQQPSTHFPFPNQFPTHATTDGHPVVCISPFITCRTEGATAWERAYWRLEDTQATELWNLPTPGFQTPAVGLMQSCDAAETHVMLCERSLTQSP